MHRCSNCEEVIDLSAAGDAGCLVVRHEGSVVAAICPACSKDVKVTKVVLVRPVKNQRFAFDTLLNVECFK